MQQREGQREGEKYTNYSWEEKVNNYLITVINLKTKVTRKKKSENQFGTSTPRDGREQADETTVKVNQSEKKYQIKNLQ